MNYSIREWLEAYLEASPTAIRPLMADQRFVKAGMQARHNGWSPTQLAIKVASRDYSNALNPVLIGLMHMEDSGARRPYSTAPTKGNSSGCLVCPPGKACEHPVTPQNVCRPEWVPARRMLLDVLQNDTNLSEKQREQAMTDLINKQRGEVAS